MVLALMIALYASVLGMIGLIAIKRWEIKTGRMLGSAVRPIIGQFFHSVAVWSAHVAPSLVRQLAREMAAFVRGTARHGTARGVLWAEKKLEVTLEAIRDKTTPHRHGGSPASAFLLEVAEHKRALARRAHRRPARMQEENKTA
ncbi:MAG: hypothetical protein JWO43_248 [Candidatus Adlerbacteria bacterium]|nr:hypothetical protein [Candidatus Adlerbacteria bacterium]